MIQAYISFADGYWHTRSAELLHSPWMETLVWIRVPADIVFGLGAALLCIFVLRVAAGRRG